MRFALLALCMAACGRSQGVDDRDLPGLVIEAKKTEAAIDVGAAAKDPAELGRALARPYRATVAALGPHGLAINSTTTVDEAGKTVSDLSDHAQIDLGAGGAYHAVYTNSADYGREAIYIPAASAPGMLYLRPRYQRWHARAPEAADEPLALRDQYADAIAATWDLLAPGAELSDAGPVTIAGRAGRKIAVKRAPTPAAPPAEPLAQRKWREGRSIDAVSGEIVLDADKGVPLAVTLTGIVGFSRDGRRFVMKLSVDSTISGIGAPAAIAAPADSEVIATPERLREVDDRDFLLQGIAPPLRRNPDGTAVAPQPRGLAPGTVAATAADVKAEPRSDKPADAKPDRPKKKRHADDDAPAGREDKK
ncbi:MAG TPA: hypothetical protein VGC42_00645 [Kofleriaceae bacterium]